MTATFAPNPILEHVTDTVITASTRGLGGSPSVGPYRPRWRPGDELGNRRFALVAGGAPFACEGGGLLDSVTVCYETWGTLNEARDNAVLILHGFTADSHAAGPAAPGHPETGWWDGVIGPGKGIDTDRWFVVCPNALGGCQGTTGPASPAADGRPYASRWPITTPRDMVAAEAGLADALGIARWHAVVGVSLGGMRALEWAVGHPERVSKAVIIGVGARASAEQIALQSMQIRAITSDPAWHGGDYYDLGDGRGPVEGMGLARRIGHLSYRSEPEMEERFANTTQPGENPLESRSARYAVESYLDHAATRLIRRFDPATYVALTEAMNHYDIGRNRGGAAAAMAAITADVTIVGLDGDRLYPLWQQRELAELSPAGSPLHIVHSNVGHDAFLIEEETVGGIVRDVLQS